jgi:hypothetical protein
MQTNLVAQTANSSPYSRYGIGDIGGKGYGQNFAMAGTSIAVQNDSAPLYFINSNNPASYSNVYLTAAELGVTGNRMQLQSTSSKKTINNASLAYLTLAVPVKKWWGAAVGLIPYSSVGYKVSDHKEINNVGPVDFLYEGSGGVNQFYVGNGIKPLYGLANMYSKSKRYQRLKEQGLNEKNYQILKRKKSWQALSIGVNASYMFGNIDNIRRSIVPASYQGFDVRSGTTTRIGGAYLDYGLQYAYTIDSLRGRDLKENVKILVGATFANQANLNAKVDSLSYTYISPYGYDIVRDTIQNIEGTKGKVTFPLSLGFGFGIKKGDRFLIAADYRTQNWSSYKIFGKTQNLKNSTQISIGGQFIPNPKASGKGTYPQRIIYRAGARYANTPLELKNTQLKEYSVTFGLGLPVGRNFLLQNFSMVNIGIELGQRGTTVNGLIKEQFVRATLGFTINDKWFVKPKFD